MQWVYNTSSNWPTGPNAKAKAKIKTKPAWKFKARKGIISLFQYSVVTRKSEIVNFRRLAAVSEDKKSNETQWACVDNTEAS